MNSGRRSASSSTPTPESDNLQVENTPHSLSKVVRKTSGSEADTMAVTVNGNHHSEHRQLNSESQTETMQTQSDRHTEYQKITIVKEVMPRGLSRMQKLHGELGQSSDDSLLKDLSIESFLDIVATERLRRMPQRGSRWDKVLKWAEMFTSQVSIYQESVSPFVLHSREAAELVYRSCSALLQMGHTQAKALERAFGVFYRLGLTLSFFLRNGGSFNAGGEIRQGLGQAYADLVMLVVDVTSFYRSKSKDMSEAFIVVDFDSHFGRTVDRLFQHKDHIANMMWMYQLQQSADLRSNTVDIVTIRQWLAPQDRTLQILTSDRMGTRSARDEYTCEWFQQHLLDFIRSKDHVLAINGKPGSGKTVLSGWIVERLQRPLGRKSYSTISFVINADLLNETTSLSVVKSLMLQLLEQSVGNVSLYKLLVAVLDTSTKTNNTSEIESALWRAFDTALERSSNLMIVIDGVDEISGGEPAALLVLDRLHRVIAKHNGVKAIVLSRPFTKALPKSTRKFIIDAKHTHEDIHHLVMRSLHSYHHFNDQRQGDIETIADRITHSAQGSFLWANMTLKNLRKEKTHAEFLHALEKVPQSLTDAIQKLVSTVDLTESNTRLLIAWLLVAERPLTLIELKNLLETDVSRNIHTRRHMDVESILKNACDSLVVVRDGIVRFWHVEIKLHLLDLSSQGKTTLLPLKDAQKDLTIRLLAYVKSCLTTHHEPSLEPLEPQVLDELFQKHQLLSYSARYWQSHFRHSPMYSPNGSHTFPVEFKSAFPGSTVLAKIERSCWELQTSVTETVDMHLLALTIRQSVLSEKHESVLQDQITIACTYEKLSQTVEASKYYYEASRLSQTIMSKQSTLAITCATAFLACTTAVTTTTRTDISNHTEEILKYIVMTEKHRHGVTSEVAIKYNTFLAQFYINIKETESAATVYKEIYQAKIERYGQFSSEAIEISERLAIVLQMESKWEESVHYNRSVFEYAEMTMKIIDVRRITITFRMAETYELQRDLEKAEETYINLWRKVTNVCRFERTTESHERKIEVTIQYTRFLQRHQREIEAESILRGLWAEYETEGTTSEVDFTRLICVGEELKTMGVFKAALSIFISVWSHFKTNKKQSTVEAASVAVLLAETVQEIHTRTESSSSYESILVEVFESTTLRSTTTKVDVSTIRTCETLSTFYTQQKRWAEALKVCYASLHSLWPSIITFQGNIELPKEFSREAIEIATRVAYCHSQELQFEKAEKIYLHIFQATKSTYHIQDEIVSKTTKTLITFYEDSKQFDKIIGVHEELIEAYRKSLGPAHALTIQTLYHLAKLCVQHDHKKSHSYYLAIMTSLNKGSNVCHADAFEASVTLANIYYQEKRWTDARNIYTTLWTTFTVRGKEYNMSTEIVKTIYERYNYILTEVVKVEYSVLRKVSVEYRESCVTVFGAHSEITLEATLLLAEVNSQNVKYQHEAVKIYEEVFSKTEFNITTSSTSTVSIFTAAKQRLAQLYIATSSSDATLTKKAVALYSERFEFTKTKFGCSHEATLTQLTETVKMYKKQENQYFHSTAISLLQSSTLEILTTEKDSQRLFDAGVTLATTYTSCGYVENAYELLKELRRQIIFRNFRSSEKFSFKIDRSIDRRSYVFLIAMEETLKGSKKVSFSEIMTELLTESILYRHYNTSITQSKSLEITLSHGAHLRSFLLTRRQQDQAKVFEDELFEIFLKRTGSAIRSGRHVTHVFFIILLEELGQDGSDSHLANAACVSGNNRVISLIEQSKFQEAYDLATCIYQFVHHHRGYHHTSSVGSGFKLSLYMAGRGTKRCSDPKLRTQMMELSRIILGEVLGACKHLQINFMQMQLTELNDLVALMGEQQKYGDLEWLLEQLWSSRHNQASWSSATIVWIGRRLVEVRFSHNDKRKSAIHLCEDIYYNLRRVWGPLDKTTIEMSTLLSQLYTSAGRYIDAMNVHEEVLRQLVSDENDNISMDEAAPMAMTHLELLKRSYQRAGGWEKDPKSCHELYSQLLDAFGNEKGWHSAPIEKWSTKAPTDNVGTFTAPTSWEFMSAEDEKKKRQNLLRRASENWAAKGYPGTNSKIAPKGAANGNVNGHGKVESKGEVNGFTPMKAPPVLTL